MRDHLVRSQDVVTPNVLLGVNGLLRIRIIIKWRIVEGPCATQLDACEVLVHLEHYHAVLRQHECALSSAGMPSTHCTESIDMRLIPNTHTQT